MDKDVKIALSELSKIDNKNKNTIVQKNKTLALPALQDASQGRDVLPTDEAARLINRKPQTLRKWACTGKGPIQPIHIYGRLSWRVADLKALLNETA